MDTNKNGQKELVQRVYMVGFGYDFFLKIPDPTIKYLVLVC